MPERQVRMKPSPIALYLLGNAASPRLDKVRAGVDLDIRLFGGVEWAICNTGGVSTFAQANIRPGIWWRLPHGSLYDDDILHLWNDHASHWLWEPKRDMPKAQYVAALLRLNALFVRV